MVVFLWIAGIVLLVFAVYWTVTSLTFSLIGGWWRLTKLYRTKSEHACVMSAGGYVSLISYSSELYVGAAPEGLYLMIYPFGRPFHRRLLIDWRALTPFTSGRILLMGGYSTGVAVGKSRHVYLTLFNEELVRAAESYMRECRSTDLFD